jgi:signal transduction histidine kinase
LDYNRVTDGSPSGPHETGMLCAPVATRDGVVGVLKVAARYTGALGLYEADLLRRFMPQASVAFQNSRRAETLQTKVLQAERKNAVADIARGVAHDVNNALGAILPLVQQLRDDCGSGEVDPDDLAGDLAEIEKSVHVCRRIFGGMLDLSRSAARGSGQANARRAVDGALAILEDGMKRRGIRCYFDLPEDLPVLPCNQGDLEQVFLNVLANARDAMPRGGELTVRLRGRGASVEALVEDTGCGIPKDDLERIHEPFFTTKPHGNGLGLSICRSILWGMHGKLRVSSKVGEGTRVRLVFPGAPNAEAEVRA